MTKNLIEIVREEVMIQIIRRAGGSPGDDLTRKNLSLIEVKECLYQTLMEIEIQQIEAKWGRYRNDINESKKG